MSGELVQRTPEQQLIQAVRGDDFARQISMALPPSVTPQRFVRIATSAIMANPEIAKLDQTSVLRAFVQAAGDGLIPDGKEAAITPRKGKAVYVPMIGGFRKLAAEHGWTLRTAVVYARDEFRHVVENGEEKITHIPVRPGEERGELIASYAIAKHRDGRLMVIVLHPADVAKRRSSAATDQVWKEHPAAMWEKSAGRALFKQLGLAELDERIERVLAATDTDPDEATRAMYGTSRTEPVGALPAASTAPRPDTTTSPSTTERASDRDGADQQAEDASPLPDASSAPDSQEPSLVDETTETSAFEAPQLAADDPIVIAAQHASQYQIPSGDNKGLSLAEVQQMGDKGVGWLNWALDQIANPPAYREAIWAFCRVYEPDLYKAAIAKRENAAA